MFKSIKFFTGVGILVIITLVGGLYFSSKNAANQEPIKIYKAIPLIKPTQVTKVTTTENNPSSEVSNWIEHIHDPAPHEHVSNWVDDFSANESGREVGFSEGTEAPTVSWSSGGHSHNDAIDQSFDPSKWIHEQMHILASQIQAEYPQFLEIQNMTLEEMESLSTKEKRKIQEISQQFQMEYLGKIRSLFSQLPPEHLEGVLSIFREKYSKQWGYEFANMIIADMRALLE